MFDHIEDILEIFESKREIYKLIAEEVKDYFEASVFSESKYTFTMAYRIKSVDSIREKLLRNSYISKYGSSEEVLSNFQDLIGFRIECKFIDDEKYAMELQMCIRDRHIHLQLSGSDGEHQAGWNGNSQLYLR